MSSDLLANNWNSFDTHELFWWRAQFSWAVDAKTLTDWQAAVLAAGDRSEILRVEKIAEVAYDRLRDGSIGDFVRARADLSSGFVLETFDPSLLSPAVVATRLSYVEDQSHIGEAWVTDMREFGYAAGLDEAHPNPPVALIVDYEPEGVDGLGGVWVVLGTSTDIWFPWNSPMGRTGVPRDEPLDNRVLSRLNGARLNAFLGEVREATLAAGGSWTCAPWREDRQANDFGVVLDAPKPTRA